MFRRHVELIVEHSPEKMRVHEVRKALAWYARGLLRRLARCASAGSHGRGARGCWKSARRSSPTSRRASGAGARRRALVRARRRGDEIDRAQRPPRLVRARSRPPRRGVPAESPPDRRLAAAPRRRRRRCDNLAPRHRRRNQHPGPPQQRLVPPATDRLAAYGRSASPRSRPRCTRRRPRGGCTWWPRWTDRRRGGGPRASSRRHLRRHLPRSGDGRGVLGRWASGVGRRANARGRAVRKWREARRPARGRCCSATPALQARPRRSRRAGRRRPGTQALERCASYTYQLATTATVA